VSTDLAGLRDRVRALEKRMEEREEGRKGGREEGQTVWRFF